MKVKSLAISLAGAVLLLSVGIAVARVAATSATIDEQGAKDAVIAFGGVGAPVSVRTSEAVIPGEADQFEVLTDAGATVWVDQEGRIRAVHGVVSRVTDIDLPMNESVARDVAEAFLAEHHPGFGSMVLSDSFRLPEDAVVFSWGEYAASGARLLREAALTVNLATGELSSYSARYEQVEGVGTEPKVSAADVVKAFSADGSHANAQVEACDLEVRKDLGGQQRLVWVVTYRPMIELPDGRHVFGMGLDAFYDAATGQDVTQKIP